jgi:hypothetical protein
VSSGRSRRCLAFLVVTVALGASASRAAAQAPAQEVDPRPAEALAACGAGDVNKGIGILAQLYAESRNPTFVFNQGRCYQQNGQLEQSKQRFREYLRVGKDEPAEDRKRAEAYVAEIDNEIERRRAEEAALRAQPGSPAAEARRRRTLRVVGIVLGGVAVASLGVGIFASQKVSSLERQYEGKIADGSVVYQEEERQELDELKASGYRYETVQYVSLGLALAAAAGAATTFALAGLGWPGSPPPERTQIALTPVVSPGLLGGQLQLRF